MAVEIVMFKPKISIITITYNSDKTLERTIQSIIGQNYENLEYLVIDGGSIDGTLDIIRKYETDISYWVSEPDEGISHAFNKGIERATGEIIGIINSDDGLCEGALEALAREYEESVEIYRGNVLLWNTKTDKRVEEIPSMHFPLVAISLNVSHQGTFITRMAYEKYGVYNKNYRYSMDYELLVRFERSGAKMKYIDYLMAFYTLGGLTFTPYSKERMHESDLTIKLYGGTLGHMCLCRLIRLTKIFLKKFINIDMILKLKSIRTVAKKSMLYVFRK